MSTPGVSTEFRQVHAQPCSKRIQVNVADQFLEVRILVANDRFIPVFKQVPVPLVPPVERNRVTREKPSHECRQAYCTASYQQVHMVWKQRPRVDPCSRECCHIPESRYKRLPIFIVPNDETL